MCGIYLSLLLSILGVLTDAGMLDILSYWEMEALNIIRASIMEVKTDIEVYEVKPGF